MDLREYSLGNVSVLGLIVKHRSSLTMNRCNHRPPALLNGCEGILQLSDVSAESLALPPRAGSAGPLCKHGRDVGQINARTEVFALPAHDHLQPGTKLAAGLEENTQTSSTAAASPLVHQWKHPGPAMPAVEH